MDRPKVSPDPNAEDAARWRAVEAMAQTEGRDGGWCGYWRLPLIPAWNDSPNPAYHMKHRTFVEAIDAAMGAERTKPATGATDFEPKEARPIASEQLEK
jgi:hypothetical protein